MLKDKSTCTHVWHTHVVKQMWVTECMDCGQAADKAQLRLLDDLMRQLVCACGNYRHHGLHWMPEGSGEGLNEALHLLEAFIAQGGGQPKSTCKVCELCSPREYKAMRALESLTAGGSEYVNDVELCLSTVRAKLNTTVSFAIQNMQKRTALEMIGNLVGAPTMQYADDSYQREVLEIRLQEISKIVQEALK